MIPSGKAHNEMLLADDGSDLSSVIDEIGRRLV
jgi:acetolactate synthase-1/2/3 large subunit